MAEVHQLTQVTEGISCHAWNADKSMVAVCPNNNEIHIYETKGWKCLFVLAEHDLLVSAIDWSAATNKIVSCSHDRNAFVWTYEPESSQPALSGNPRDPPMITPATWKPALVILRIDRAAIDVKWSLDGLRFAVASGAKCVPVCTYDEVNDWWVCKMVKKFKSTVLCCAFHPTNGQLLATGSSDFKCRIFSTFASDVDGSNVNAGPFASTTGPLPFGEAYCELSALGWIHAVAWSPSGNSLAYAGHDSSLHIANLAAGKEPVVQSVRLASLPLSSLLFLSENSIVGGGHDFNPAIFINKSGTWSFYAAVDKGESGGVSESSSGVSAARELFKNKTIRGQDIKSDADTIKTKHQRAITLIQDATPARKTGGSVSVVSTSSLDGSLVLWDLPMLNIKMSELQL